jgi:tetratricopeptide (TPR) repeat protein
MGSINLSLDLDDIRVALAHCQEISLLKLNAAESDVAESDRGSATSDSTSVDLSEAIAACEQALETEDLSLICQRFADVLKALNQLEEVRIWLAKAIEIQPKSVEAHMSLGQILHEMWELDAAASTYRQAIAINAQSWEAHYHLGLTLATQGQIKEAIASYRRSIDLNSKFYWSHQRLGEALVEAGHLDAAAASYRCAIELNPQCYLSYLYLADLLQSQGDLEEATNCYQQTIQLNPKSSIAYHQLGQIWAQSGKFTAAADFYRRAIELNPEFCWSYHFLGEALAAQGSWHEAADCYRQAIQLNPDSFESYEKLGNALTCGGQYRLFPWLKNELLQDGRLDEAITCYQQAIHRNINNAWSHLQLGYALIEKDKIDEAIHHCQLACYYHTIQSQPALLKKVWNLSKPHRPNFLIAGTSKGGTTSLYEYLIEHPKVISAVQKETAFFSHYFEQGLDWYLAHFPPAIAGEDFLTGEATPFYLDLPYVEERLFSSFPEIKIIILLRNPIDRTISHYYQGVKYGREKRSLSAAVLSEIEALKDITEATLTEAHYFDDSLRYVLQSLYLYPLKKWMALFPKEQFLILKSEDLYSNPAQTVSRVFKFLNLPDYQSVDYLNHYPGFYDPNISTSLRWAMAEYFKPHNQKLEDYLGLEFDWN